MLHSRRSFLKLIATAGLAEGVVKLVFELRYFGKGSSRSSLGVTQQKKQRSRPDDDAAAV